MGMGGGGKSTTQETKEIRLPPWVEQASQENYQRAQQVANRPYAANPFETYTAPLGHQYDAALGMVKGLQEDFSKYGGVESALSGLLTYNPADIAPSTVGVESLAGKDLTPYLNPWISNVEARSIDNAQRAGRERQVQLASEATKAKAFGGTRQAVQQGVAEGETMRQIGDLSANLRKEGFQQAQAAAVGDITREYEAAKQRGDWAQAAQIASRSADLQAHEQAIAAGKTITDTANAEQNARMNAIATRLGLGQMKSDWLQAASDKKGAAWQKARDYPLEQLNILMAALGMSPYGHTETGTSTTRQSGGGGAGQALGAGMGLLKMFGGLMGMSDPEAKTNIEPAGFLGDLPIYAYDYKADVAAAKKAGRPMGPKRVGPMATDLPNRRLKSKGKVKGRRIIDLTHIAA